MDGFAADTRIKRAQYIDRNNDLIQGFGFAHPKVQSRLNMIYNTKEYDGKFIVSFSQIHVEFAK